MFSLICWSQTDPFTTKSNNIYCQYLKFFKLILSRFPQCKKLQRNKNSQYLQFLKLELSPYPQFKRYRKVVKIKLDIKIHNFSYSNCPDALHSESTKTNCPDTPNLQNIKSYK